MIHFKHLIITSLLSLVASVPAFAQEDIPDTPETPPVDLASKSYTWTDAAGIEHTSYLYDVATDPNQIAQLLKLVYIDPEIPGQVNIDRGDDPASTVPTTIDYNKNKAPWIECQNIVVPQPTEGATLMIVKIKQFSREVNNKYISSTYLSSLNKFVEVIDKTIESVQVIPNIVKVDDPDNPGYIAMISGRFNRFCIYSKGKRRDTNNSPVGKMFEDISPTVSSSLSSTESFRDEMLAGNVWQSPHDCGSTIFMSYDYPHYFIINKDGSDSPVSHLTYFLPDKRLNYWDQTTHPGFKWDTAGSRDTNGAFTWYHPDHAPLTFIYRANISASGKDAEEVTKYSITVNWKTNLADGTNVDLTVPQTFNLYVRRKGTSEWTLLREGVSDLTYTYEVDREDAVYELEYQVRAHVDGFDETEFCYTAVDKVTVPPLGTGIVVASIHPYYRSRFDADNEINIYKNTFGLKRSADFMPGTYYMKRSGTDIAKIVVDAEGGCFVTYLNQQLEYTFDDEEPAVEGNLVDGINIVDRFYVSTAGNEHPDHYDYTLDLMKGSLYVPVYKSETKVSPYAFTAQEINNDLDHTLQSNGVAVSMSAPKGDNIDVYEAYRNGETKINQRRPNDSWYTVTDTEGDTYNWYVTQVTTRRFEESIIDTYGTARDEAYRPKVSVTATNCWSVHSPNPGEDDLYLSCDLTIKSEMPEKEGYRLIGYRVWRTVDENPEKLIAYGGAAPEKVITDDPQAISAIAAISSIWPAESEIYTTDYSDELESGRHQTMKYLVRAFMQGPDGKISLAEDRAEARSGNMTGIGELNGDGTPESVIYYNALGIPSETPFEGVNIVVKHFPGKASVVTREIH